MHVVNNNTLHLDRDDFESLRLNQNYSPFLSLLELLEVRMYMVDGFTSARGFLNIESDMKTTKDYVELITQLQIELRAERALR
ncbi:hypothetical protein [Paenibacillus xylanexedens]|uniref:hypothetical protein n=1 Tax=Paenibacillus xylanexedens TaxID=528191 RepID=UPI0011A306DE|nr:hypothetical protein [Paenibacillus xylanexedens]